MIVFIFILLTIYLLYYVTYSKNEYYTSFNVDAIQEKLDKIKLKAKKYNPVTRKHEIFIEKKLPPHSK